MWHSPEPARLVYTGVLAHKPARRQVSKFDSLRARVLYGRASTDEEVGSSSEGIGWAGLYMRWEGAGGYILQEDVEGFVTLESYTSDEALNTAWLEIAESLEFTGDPQHHDYVIQANERTSKYFCMNLGSDTMFDSVDEIVIALAEQQLQKPDVLPDVWFLNERGNFMPVAVADYLQD
jgi:hypothetical protein